MQRSRGKPTAVQRTVQKTTDNFQSKEFGEFFCVYFASDICTETNF